MSPRILIVDDHPDIVHLLSLVLRSEAYDVITATCGHDALSQWRAHAPDLVLLDINLPGITGDEVCRQIKAAGSTPVVMMTGRAASDAQVSQIVPLADACVVKPFDIADLLERIPALLDRRQAAPVSEVAVGALG